MNRSRVITTERPLSLPRRANAVSLALTVLSAALPGTAAALTVPFGTTVTISNSQCGTSIGGLLLDGGTLVGPQTCAVFIDGGTLSSGIITAGEFRTSTGSSLSLTGPVSLRSGSPVTTMVNHRGTFTQSGGGALELWFSASFVNEGVNSTYRITNDQGIRLVSPSESFTNLRMPGFENRTDALFVKSGSNGNSFVSAPFFNQGTVRAESGGLVFNGGGTHLNAAFEVPGGSISLQGPHRFSGAVSLANGGGDLFSSGFIQVNDLTIDSTAEVKLATALRSLGAAGIVNRGTVTGDAMGSGRVSVYAGSPLVNEGSMTTGVLSIDGPGPGVLNKGTMNLREAYLNADGLLDNQGSLRATQMTIREAATLRNSGLFTAGRMTQSGAFDNAAGGRVDIGDDWTSLDFLSGVSPSAAAFTNAGHVNVSEGRSMVVYSFTQTEGMLTVNGHFESAPGETTTVSGGTLNGSGRINGDVFIGGGPGTASFKPGNSPGRFIVTGMLTMGPNSELELEVARDASGALAWDQIQAGSLSFASGSTVRFVIGPDVASTSLQAIGSFFACAGGSCMFDPGVMNFVVDGLDGATVQASPFGIVLSVPAALPVPEPSAALLLLAGLACIGSLAGRQARRAPACPLRQ